MYSFYDHGSIKILYRDQLQKYLNKRFDKECEYATALLNKDGTLPDKLSFEGWDGYKIIEYFYEEMLEFLRDIAVFIEGTVRFNYEDGDTAANITFKKGECHIKMGTMNWTTHELKEFGILKPMNKKLKAFKLATKI